MSLLSKLMMPFVFLGCIALAFVIDETAHQSHPGDEKFMYNVLVIRELDETHYRLKDSSGTVFVAKFCDDDSEPQFGYPGTVLDVLHFRDYGFCWSLKDMHPAYLLRRDALGKPLREIVNE